MDHPELHSKLETSLGHVTLSQEVNYNNTCSFILPVTADEKKNTKPTVPLPDQG